VKSDLSLFDAEIMSGDIIVVQAVADHPGVDVRFASFDDFLRYKCHELRMEFRPIDQYTEVGVLLTMNGFMHYQEIVARLAEHLSTDPDKIQLTSFNTQYEEPGSVIPCNTPHTLDDLRNFQGSLGRILLFEQIPLPIAEFERKLRFTSLTWLDPVKFECISLDVLLDPGSTAADLMREASAQSASDTNMKEYPRLRLVSVTRHRITDIIAPDYLLDRYMARQDLRLEVLPDEQIIASDDSSAVLVKVVHIRLRPTKLHGIPFLFVMREGETYSSLRERLRLEVKASKAEVEKWKIGQACGTEFAEFGEADIVDLAQWRGEDSTLAIDHIDKNPKRPKYALAEKAVVIRN
jgi:ubiquitin carboxyl-terminal hydrolase 7